MMKNMRRTITTFLSALALFGFGLFSPAAAAEVEKEPLTQDEILELAAEESADIVALEDVEAGELNAGAGLFILVVIGIAVLVAAD